MLIETAKFYAYKVVVGYAICCKPPPLKACDDFQNITTHILWP